MLKNKFLFGAILTALVCLTACSNGNTEVTKTSVTTASESVSTAEQTTATEAKTEMQETEKVTETTAESTEISEYKYKSMLEKYILYEKRTFGSI